MTNSEHKILIVDNELDILELLKSIFIQKGFSVTTAKNGKQALVFLKKDDYAVLITDLIMPGMDGIELLNKTKKHSPYTEVILMTGHGTIQSAVDAIKNGAYNYIEKPINPEYLLLLVERVIKLSDLRAQNLYLKNELGKQYNFKNIIGTSLEMRQIFELIKSVAGTNSTVLIRGESGTGKELIANAIHYSSQRNEQKMIRVNCAVFAETLLESELFGHEKGSFTGAIRDRTGRFELADNGTLFLDEIGELSTNLQVKLLRVLQENEFERVGGSKTIKVNVRIIAATNKNLEQAIKKGEFREDLYYRLNVIPINVPPLRNRIDDIPLLVNHFIEKYRIEIGKNLNGISEEAMLLLMDYNWHGNVRELENIIERAVVLTRSTRIEKEDLFPINNSAEEKNAFQMLETMSLPEVMDNIERDLMLRTLTICNWNKSLASRKLGIHRTTFLSKMSKHNLDNDRD